MFLRRRARRLAREKGVTLNFYLVEARWDKAVGQPRGKVRKCLGSIRFGPGEPGNHGRERFFVRAKREILRTVLDPENARALLQELLEHVFVEEPPELAEIRLRGEDQRRQTNEILRRIVEEILRRESGAQRVDRETAASAECTGPSIESPDADELPGGAKV